MVNPGSFQGSRKAFLIAEKPSYAAGVAGGYAVDALSKIQRRYFKRFPVDLPHEEEPDPAHLEAVDDDAPDVEQCGPDPDVLSEAEFAKAKKKVEIRRALVTFRKAQIKRWLAYQYMKDHDMDPKESGAVNPYRVLLHQLTGVRVPRPRLRTPVNVWRKTQRENIDAEVARRLSFGSVNGSRRKELVGTRDKVAREMFDRLSEVDKNQWAEQAKEEHEAALVSWKEESDRKPSTDPVARQRCIHGLTRFVQPILDSIVEATGWKVSLIAGGPEPADDGRLNVISIHSGTTRGEVQMNFGCAERIRYKKFIVPIFGSFLQQCYTVEECRARALPAKDGHLRMSGLDLDDEGVNFDQFERAGSSTSTSSSSVSTGETAPTSVSSDLDSPASNIVNLLSSTLPSAASTTPPQSSETPNSHEPTPPPAVPVVSAVTSPSTTLGIVAPLTTQSTKPSLPQPTTSNTHQSCQPPTREPSLPRFSPPIGSRPPSPAIPATTSLSAASTPPLPPPCPSAQFSPADRSAASCPPPGASSTSASPSADVLAAEIFGATTLNSARALQTESNTPAVPPLPAPSCPPSGSLHKIAHLQPSSDAAIPSPSPSAPLRSRSLLPPLNDEAHSQQLPAPDPSSDQQNRPASKRTHPDPTADDDSPPPKRSRPPTAIDPVRHLRSATSLRRTSSSPPIPEKYKHKQAPITSSSAKIPPLPSSSTRSSSPETSSPPDWFTGVKSMFESEALGDNWSELIRVWSLFEERRGYTGEGKLLNTSRPEAVAQWIKRKRSATWRPIINLTSYEEDFRLWWTALQPSWRISDGAIVLQCLDGDWGVLDRSGINGIVSVLAAIFFWGCHIIEVHEDLDMWTLVVKDCIQAVSHLVDGTEE